MKFSERKGFRTVSGIIQTQDMSNNLRNSLWNVLELKVWRRENFLDTKYGEPEIEKFSVYLWMTYFKEPIATISDDPIKTLRDIRNHFFSCAWFEVYDFLEAVLEYFDYFNEDNKSIIEMVNTILERELAGYRYIGGVFTDITDQQEINMLESALTNDEFPGVRAHIQRALELLSNREQPDYRNSIKESISAVESLACIITSNPKATLGDALKTIELKWKIHPALKEAFSKLYGYTSDEGGIRHAMLEEPNLSPADAKFFLLSCTSFINYLKSKV
jgi:hypothetical protein